MCKEGPLHNGDNENNVRKYGTPVRPYPQALRFKCAATYMFCGWQTTITFVKYSMHRGLCNSLQKLCTFKIQIYFGSVWVWRGPLDGGDGREGVKKCLLPRLDNFIKCTATYMFCVWNSTMTFVKDSMHIALSL